MSSPLYLTDIISFEHLLPKGDQDFVPCMTSVYKELINYIPDSMPNDSNCVVVIQLLKSHSNYKFNQNVLDRIREHVFKTKPNVELYIEIEPYNLHVVSPRIIKNISQYFIFPEHLLKEESQTPSKKIKKEQIIAPLGIKQYEINEMYDAFFGTVDESFLDVVSNEYFKIHPNATEVEFYQAANLDSKQYYELKNKYNGTPRNKYCAIALCLTVHPTLEEMNMLLSRAGLSLSSADNFDRFIECCIMHKVYNVHEINQILAEFYADKFLQFSNREGNSKMK